MDDENKTFTICYYRGRMSIKASTFFPAKVGTLRKLIKKAIDLDYEQGDKIKDDMYDWCKARIDELRSLPDHYKTEVIKLVEDRGRLKAQWAEIPQRLRRAKHYRQIKNELTICENRLKYIDRELKKAPKLIEIYKKNMEVLNGNRYASETEY